MWALHAHPLQDSVRDTMQSIPKSSSSAHPVGNQVLTVVTGDEFTKWYKLIIQHITPRELDPRFNTQTFARDESTFD